MKFYPYTLCLLMSLFSVVAHAGPAEVLCNIVTGANSNVQFDIVIDGTSGRLDGFTVRHVSTPASSTPAPDDHFDFPTAGIPNFWIDSSSLKLRGYSSDTQSQDLLLDYDKLMQVGSVTMNRAGFVFDNQIITCTFD